ncbi:hypothetical protein SAMN04487974_11126 [Pelagibacterium luteolum]|uniref:Uncharacterized protein n=2 Tax=Pelagibacterium luteolum TaxID=440168 RepID=A0A1G7XVW0_9HYPH|nr:hypothetical protein SAMN04487974_11126 [Pelagibacterium luteolum]
MFLVLYVLAIWLVHDEVAEGWTTTTSLLAFWMSAQLAATSVVCLGISRALDTQERARMPRLIEETTVSDLFSLSGVLNVENGADSAAAHPPEVQGR